MKNEIKMKGGFNTSGFHECRLKLLAICRKKTTLLRESGDAVKIFFTSILNMEFIFKLSDCRIS